jgi:DNA-binding FadR family transcriptional regulator
MPRDESPEQDPYTLTMRTASHWQTGSMVHEIAEILHERIVEGRLAPQEPLTQWRVAEDLNVTRAMAGEELRMLRCEVLVDTSAGPTRVEAADSAVLLSAYAVREMVDGLAAGLAACHSGAGTQRRCRAALEELRAAAEVGDRSRSMRIKGLGPADETGRSVLDSSLGLWPVRAAQSQDRAASDLHPRINPEVDGRRLREAFGSSA